VAPNLDKRIKEVVVETNLFARMAMMILLATLVVPVQSWAQQHRYKVIDLGTLGGEFSSGFGVNDLGWADGYSTLPAETITHAFVWQDRVMTDIGTPGLNSLAAYPFNDVGEVAILAEVSALDPSQPPEDFCGFGTHRGCPPFVWKDGVLTQLPTLGGNNGHASQVNDLGEVSGVAENSTPDPTCKPQECVESICPYQQLQTKPVLWKNGQIQELLTWQDDPDGNGLVINYNGDVAGTSGKCIGSANEALHAVLWRNGGTPIDLGNLGGTTNHHPQFINNLGQVVGYSNLPGDQTNHAFLWDGVMRDLGTLPGDFSSGGEAINDAGLVGGFSCHRTGRCRAFLWQNDVMTDLNPLLIPGSTLFLVDVNSINSAGELVGDAIDLRTREQHAYLAIPVQGEVANDVTSAESVGTLDPALSGSTRQILEQRLGGGRYRIPGPQATLSPTTLTFPSTLVGTTSPAQYVTLSNNGNGTLNIANITVTDYFDETNNCGPTLTSKASCTFSVTFTPTTTGTLDGTLSVTDNTKNSPQAVSLTGNGLPSGGVCSTQGRECGALQLPPCCPGLVCVPASTRAFCEP
jgi:probable HAF family extracellular repeat protein